MSNPTTARKPDSEAAHTTGMKAIAAIPVPKPTKLVLLRKAAFKEEDHPRVPVGGTAVDSRGNIETGGQFAAKDPRFGFAIKRTVNAENQWRSAMVNLYKDGDWSAIAVREMLQNSVDACREAVAVGEVSKGKVDFTVGDGTITCRDNGIGMTMAQIDGKFLKLAEEKDASTVATGGFGQAKAVILGVSEDYNWTLKSRDGVIHGFQSLDPAFTTGPQNILDPPIQGTELTVRNCQMFTPETMAEAVRFSDPAGIDASIEYTDSDGRRQTGRSGDITRGRKIVSLDATSKKWTDGTYGCEYDVKLVSGGPAAGLAVVRINGLMQFTKNFSDELKSRCLLVDITVRKNSNGTPLTKPGDWLYPVTSGRDALKGGVTIRRRDMHQNVIEDRISAEKMLDATAATLGKDSLSSDKEKNFSDVVYRDPYATGSMRKISFGAPRAHAATDQQESSSGGGAAREDVGEEDYATGMADFIAQTNRQFESALAGGGVRTVTRTREDQSAEAIIATMKPIVDRLATVVGDYEYEAPSDAWMVRRDNPSFGKKKFDVAEHMRLLAAWDTICHVMGAAYTSTGKSVGDKAFGTGFYLSVGNGEGTHAGAMCTRSPAENPYLLLNPIEPRMAGAVKDAMAGKPWKLTMMLHRLAGHEMGHLLDIGGGHDENFSSRREDIPEETEYLIETFHDIVSACFDKKEVRASKVIAAQAKAEARQQKQEQTVSFKDLMQTGAISAGDRLVMNVGSKSKGHKYATVLRDGQIEYVDPYREKRIVGSIHKVAAEINGWPQANGWTMWMLDDVYNGYTPIDRLRKEHNS